jgi:hypothetical protein
MLARIVRAAVVVLAFAGAAGADAAELPVGSNLDLVLVTPLDERTVAANPDLTFKTMREIRKDGAVLVPKNAAVAARVTRILKQSSTIRGTKRNYYIVGLRLLSVNTGQESIPLVANLETVAPSAMNDYFAPLSHGPDKWGEFEQYRFQFKFPDAQPGESYLGVVREGLGLPKGFRLIFRTLEP